jgi:hypothetical protein
MRRDVSYNINMLINRNILSGQTMIRRINKQVHDMIVAAMARDCPMARDGLFQWRFLDF